MEIQERRRYEDTNVGEFEYTVDRSYVGECSLVGGALLTISGNIIDVDVIFGNRNVGYLNMIDTTLERMNNMMTMNDDDNHDDDDDHIMMKTIPRKVVLFRRTEIYIISEILHVCLVNLSEVESITYPAAVLRPLSDYSAPRGEGGGGRGIDVLSFDQ